MKKIFITLLVLIAFVNYEAMSQCTPVQFPGPDLAQPDTLQGLPNAIATDAYETVISLRIPADTIIPPVTIPLAIDSAGVKSVSGLPTGLSWITNSVSDYWPGGTYGCIKISGTPLQADTGNHEVRFVAEVWVAGVAMEFNINYDLYIMDSIYASIESIERATIAISQNNPNPFNNKTNISFYSEKNQKIIFEVYNSNGALLRQESIEAASGMNNISFERENLPDGIYIYKLSDGKFSYSKRMIIQ